MKLFALDGDVLQNGKFIFSKKEFVMAKKRAKK